MALSQRFSNIRLAIDSSEDECEPDDLEILNKLIGNRFKHSCPSTLHLELGRSDSVHSDNEDDDDKLEMDIGWKADFEASLKKSRENQNNASRYKTTCLKISPVSVHVLNVRKDKLENQTVLHETDIPKQVTKSTEITETIRQKAEISEVENLSKNKSTDSKPTTKTQDSSKRNSETSNKPTSNQSKAKKDIKKPKVYNIEPAVSFPLDDLLPSNNQKQIPNKSNSQSVKNKEPKGENISPAVSVNSPQIMSSLSTESPQIWSSTSSQTSSISLQTFDNTFYGAVYTDNGDFEAHDNFEVHNDYSDVMLQCTGRVMDQNMETEEPMWTSDGDNGSIVPKDPTQSFINFIPGFNNVPAQNYENSNSSNNASGPTSSNCLLEAMQYGNMVAIEKIKAALNAKLVQTRQDEKSPDLDANGDDGGFGFYKDRNEIPIENSPENKSEEELFQLLVQQIYALAETEEDKVKVESSLREFKDDWRAKLLDSLSENDLEEQEPSNQTEEATSQDQPHIENEKHNSTHVDPKGDKELFEGRTLLKGGVNPRHIPKTNIHKDEEGRPKDPRNPIRKSINIKLTLPGFHDDFQKEVRNKERKIPYNSKDPRCLRMVSNESNKNVCPAPVNESDVRGKTDNKESSHSKLPEADRQNTISQSRGRLDFGVINSASPSHISKSWDQEQQNVIQVIINQSPSLNAKEGEIKTEYRPSVLQSVNIVSDSDVDLTNVDMDIANEQKHGVIKISDDYETDHLKSDKLKLNMVNKGTKGSERNVKTDTKDSERNLKTDIKGLERKNIFSRLGAKKTAEVTKREIEDLRNMLNRGLENVNDSEPGFSTKDSVVNAHQESERKDKNVVDNVNRLERESRSRSRDLNYSIDLEQNKRMFKRCQRSSSVSSTDSRDSDRRVCSSSRVKYKEHRNKYRTTSSNESKFTGSNRHGTSRERSINVSRNEANAVDSKMVKGDRFPSQCNESNIININFAKNPRDSSVYRSRAQNLRESSVDRPRAQNSREASIDRSCNRNPREASVDRSRAQYPGGVRFDRSRSGNPREVSVDRSRAQYPGGVRFDRSRSGNPREVSVDRSHAQNPREAHFDESCTQNPRDARIDKSQTRNPREASVDRSLAQNPRDQRPFSHHKSPNQSESIDTPQEGYQSQTKDENKRCRDPICDRNIEQGKFVQSFRPVMERSCQEPLSDGGNRTSDCSKNEPPNEIRPLSSIKDRLAPRTEQKFDLRSTLSSKSNRKRQHDHDLNIEEIDEKKTKNQTVTCKIPDLRDKIKGSVSIDKADKDKTVSDKGVQEEFKVKFTKSGSCGAAEAGNSTGLFSALGKHSLQREPCSQRTAKALKQVEDDRKFLEEYKKKILFTSGKFSPNQSISSLSSSNLSASSSSDLSKISTDGLSYSDMLGLAELEKK